MTYSQVLRGLAARIDGLDARRQAALFWLLGSGLLANLTPPAAWAEWIGDARSMGYGYVVRGEVSEAALEGWERAQTPTGGDVSQWLNSLVICLSTPLGLALGRCHAVGAWFEHALFPLIQHESLRLFDDVALPDDDEDLELVVAQPSVQRAIAYGHSVLDRLERLSKEPDATLMEELLADAAHVSPPAR